MKTCARCGVEKPVTEFRKWRQDCKTCERVVKQENRGALVDERIEAGDVDPDFGKTKACRTCGEVKALAEFSPDLRARDRRYSTCKGCMAARRRATYAADPEAGREYMRNWKADNPGARREANRKADIPRRFGISVYEYDARKSEVTHCGICGTDDPGVKGWSLDHCHSTGKIRKFLCNNCNTGLGLFRDDPERLIRAAEYILEHRNMLQELFPELRQDIEE